MPRGIFTEPGNTFITPQRWDQLRKAKMHGPNGWLLFAALPPALDFATNVKREYESFLARKHSKVLEVPMLSGANLPICHPDGETCPRLDLSVAGANVYLFQNVHDQRLGARTPNDNFATLLQTSWTLKDHGAQTVTVVTPYSPYARQDGPTFRKRESPLTAWVASNLAHNGAACHLIYHPHSYSIHGCYGPDMGIRLVALSGMDLFLDAFQSFHNDSTAIVVSTDTGGAKFSAHLAEAMGISYAVADKQRRGKNTSSIGVIGKFKGKNTAIITDDETATGGTLCSVVKVMHERGLSSHVAISHVKLNEEAVARFKEANERYGLLFLHVTDTVPQSPGLLNLPFVNLHPLAGPFARVINHLHYGQSVSDLSAYQKK